MLDLENCGMTRSGFLANLLKIFCYTSIKDFAAFRRMFDGMHSANLIYLRYGADLQGCSDVFCQDHVDIQQPKFITALLVGKRL